ncbi:MAG: response regulator [Planctomycetota bacterium]
MNSFGEHGNLAQDRAEQATPLVFVVDDNPQNCELIVGFLDDLDVDLKIFTSGQDALEACEARVPDLVVLDVMMPRLSGYQVCERLRADERTARIPIILLTALNESADVERGLEAGADDFLVKPVQRMELVTRVHAQLAVRSCEARVQSVVAGLRSVFSLA